MQLLGYAMLLVCMRCDWFIQVILIIIMIINLYSTICRLSVSLLLIKLFCILPTTSWTWLGISELIENKSLKKTIKYF